MPNFANPFSGNVQRKMTRGELLRVIRLNIAGEQEAIFLYEAHADACNDKIAAKVFRDIAKEEKVHVHELQTLLYLLDNEEDKAANEGSNEVQEMLHKEVAPELLNVSFENTLSKRATH